jgi:putative ABC transport system permease protein
VRGALYLAWRSVLGHKVQSALLVLALTLTIVLPWAAHLLLERYSAQLTARAAVTPLVAGARGGRFDLVLKSLYFRPGELRSVPRAELDRLRRSRLGLPIGLHLRYTAGGVPLVGVSFAYFDFRDLRAADGNLPAYLGEAVLGADAAAALGVRPGETLLTDPVTVYDIAKAYPLKLHVVGVLAKTHTADDDAVFVDLRTAWLVDGYFHGHQDVTQASGDAVLERGPDEIKASAALVEYNEVTPETIGSFHVHGDPGDLPLTAIIVVPRDPKSATLLKARYAASETVELVAPAEVVEELLHLVFRIKAFFDFSFLVVLASAGLFLTVVVLLLRQARRRERETMHRLGCSRWTVLQMFAAEFGILLVASLAIGHILAQVALWAMPAVVRIL